MADRPLPAPLPADLPEDWSSGQIVAPEGADVGLSEQHGYNYLMGQVNAAQRAVNTINEGFDGISGKRTCRFVIGTSTAGWTQADCDYLCDGTDDQVEIQAAVDALRDADGGTLVILAGTYNLTNNVNINDHKDFHGGFSLIGNPGVTVLNLPASGNIDIRMVYHSAPVLLSGLTLKSAGRFSRLNATNAEIEINGCTFVNIQTGLYSNLIAHANIRFQNNLMIASSDSDLPNGILNVTCSGDEFNRSKAYISGNFFDVSAQPSGQDMIVNVDASDDEVIVENNVVWCAEKGWVIQTRGSVLFANNRLHNVSAVFNSVGPVTGNFIFNASVTARSPSITGNYLRNTPVVITTATVVSGNWLYNEHGAALTVRKGSSGETPDLTPVIVGNFFNGGDIGIYLSEAGPYIYEPEMSHALISGNRVRGCATAIQIDSDWSSCMITDNLFEGSIVNNGTGNIIRLNSDDPGGGGSTSGVTSFKGRTGIVTPQSGDYTAEMVGARPDTWTPTAADVGAVTAEQLNAAIRAAVLDSWEGSY